MSYIIKDTITNEYYSEFKDTFEFTIYSQYATRFTTIIKTKNIIKRVNKIRKTKLRDYQILEVQ